ncbi:putative colanic acid biosynthesis acetyltransferase [Mucilaginibacter limnophilus]|uniref:Putative colanic acid biosynthesis acetyltransferase n=1 Tax=Mucilaginibacter limnophilus TaxID=1932778 RepID=A0A3S3TFD7_9SPHI|nr:putative colanic acid biosynthesis acetyltransferase [Mucilaginibacter limnophilus]RVT99759.1 putative colanic acid biosynthesis acetyltransferase [Mucilaginibacter limnophilus]
MEDISVNMTEVRHVFSLKNKLSRVLWAFISFFLFRPFSPRLFRKWRIFLLRCFGAKIGSSCTVHSSVKIWAPWNLEVGDFTCIGPAVDCYNQGKIVIGSNATISQKAYLCASTHDFTDTNHTLVLKPITIMDRAWIAADAFVGPGVTIGEGAVVGARAAVYKNVQNWTVVGGNPAVFIKDRKILK